LPYLIVSIIFFIFIYVIDCLYKENNNSSRITKKVETVFQKKEAEAEMVLSQLVRDRTIVTNKLNRKSHEEKYELNLPNDLAILVYIKDSLVFWSDNSIPFLLNYYTKNNDHSDILRLKNGWYDLHKKNRGDSLIVGLILLKHEYLFQNDYLKNEFQKDFPTSSQVKIVLSKGINPIFSANGDYRFSLVFPEEMQEKRDRSALLLLCFIIGGLFSLIFLFKLYQPFTLFSKNGILFIVCYSLDVLIIRLIQYYLRFPYSLYKTDLFGPALYSSSVLLPSLGDVIINSILILVISYVFYLRWPKTNSFETRSSGIRGLAFLTTLCFLIAGFLAIVYFIHDFILNSSLPLNLQNISGIKAESFYGIFIFWTLWFSYLMVSWRLLSNCLTYLGAKPDLKISISVLISAIAITSIVTMLESNHANDFKEKEKRQLLALKLASNRNPVTEILFSQLEKSFVSDTLISLIQKLPPSFGTNTEDSLSHRIMDQFNNDYWSRYNIQITICPDGKMLQIQPQGFLISCNEYFEGILKEYGNNTTSENLFFLNYGYGNENYLAVIPIGKPNRRDRTEFRIYIEINSKFAYKDLGYPELLIDRKLLDIPDISDYSYAYYQNGRLLHRIGKYAFCFELKHYLTNASVLPYFQFDGMDHYMYRINHSNVLIISKKHEPFLTIISPFSYFFIFFGFATVLFYLAFRYPYRSRFSPRTLRARLQISMMSILVISFVILGIVMVIHIIRLNNGKNTENLKEKTMSILIEIQHKFGSIENLPEAGKENLENLLIKLSNVFFTDINLYHPSGRIIASSRPQVFEEGLLSDRIDPTAYWYLKYEKNSIYIHKEKIGEHAYNSAYAPFYNDRNHLLAYINLPFFSRQDDLKKEIASFLVAFINIYLFLILLGVLLAYIVSKYLTSPLRILANKMSHIRLGITNEKIDWNRSDEIGKLVEEYNRMVVELEKSAEKIARSEREGAWREMAKQVAHEIKNPLTPMKLSVQYLRKTWEEKIPGWDLRLEKFTQMLIEQIETLSTIASDFSDFANLPLPVNEKVDLNEVIHSAIALYQTIENITIEIDIPYQNSLVWADRKQLSRIFTNLLNNSVDAIGKGSLGKIDIHLEYEGLYWVIGISDTGSGVSPDQVGKIFQPYFTTKSGGMGLGLAIVKGLVENMGGQITFTSFIGKGTTFIIKIPIYREQNHIGEAI